MAQSLAAGLVHILSLPYAPYLVAIINFDACLDRDFIDRSRYCGAVNIWGTGRVHIQGKGCVTNDCGSSVRTCGTRTCSISILVSLLCDGSVKK